MNLQKVLFIGGDGGNLPSSQIRCLDIARRLGCDWVLGIDLVQKIPEKYSVFVCVKPSFARDEIAALAKRGKIVWDIVDEIPPRDHIAVYLASTVAAQEIFHRFGRVEIIPHHHCNVENLPNPPDLRRPAWIGSCHWRPRFHGIDHDYYDVLNMQRTDVVRAHRKIGIGLNFRTNQPYQHRLEHQRLLRNFHVAINSGIKLINCLAFGTPSVSAREPAYCEIAPECTIFSTLAKCAHWVKALQADTGLYNELRRKCLRKAPRYHLDVIAEKYRRLLVSL
ncbi:MAG TPA: hypothetical protein VHC95_03245 [Opitutales bacterium]|nr:hypothetical protein [Opitutales bacterium]